MPDRDCYLLLRGIKTLALRIRENLVRLSVGIEDARDLIDDLGRALASI